MTGIVRDLDQQKLDGLAKVEDWKTLDQGVATLLVAAFDPALNSEPGPLPCQRKNSADVMLTTGENGVYLDDCQFRKPSKWASDPEKAARLWKLSEELVGQDFCHGKKSHL